MPSELPHSLDIVGSSLFEGTALTSTSIIFRPRVSAAFITWTVSNSRNRANWQLTTVKRLRNVLRIITTLALERRDVTTLDPDGCKNVFKGCDALDGASTDADYIVSNFSDDSMNVISLI